MADAIETSALFVSFDARSPSLAAYCNRKGRNYHQEKELRLNLNR